LGYAGTSEARGRAGRGNAPKRGYHLKNFKMHYPQIFAKFAFKDFMYNLKNFKNLGALLRA
tara:strand:+ start:3421 stop:3603 length:183 start_codon:yes stop_codon:yes gene_type:complete